MKNIFFTAIYLTFSVVSSVSNADSRGNYVLSKQMQCTVNIWNLMRHHKDLKYWINYYENYKNYNFIPMYHGGNEWERNRQCIVEALKNQNSSTDEWLTWSRNFGTHPISGGVLASPITQAQYNALTSSITINNVTYKIIGTVTNSFTTYSRILFYFQHNGNDSDVNNKLTNLMYNIQNQDYFNQLDLDLDASLIHKIPATNIAVTAIYARQIKSINGRVTRVAN